MNRGEGSAGPGGCWRVRGSVKPTEGATDPRGSLQGGPGSQCSAMAPPPLCRLPRSLPPWLLLLLSVALLGFQARAEPAAGNAVPAQSTCVAEGSPRGPDATGACESSVPPYCSQHRPCTPSAVGLPGRPFGGRCWGGAGLG